MGVESKENRRSSSLIQKAISFCFLVIFAIYCYLRLFYRFIVPRSLKPLNGEIFLITGSSSGIGKAVALHLAKHHPETKLVLWDQNLRLNLQTAFEARKLGAIVHAYEVDVTDRKKVRETALKVQSEVGNVTILYNNAGIAQGTQFFTCPEQELEKTIQVNLISHFWTLRAFLPSMIANNHGHIVTTASLGSFFGHKSCVPYFAAKFAIRGYVESLQDELNSMPDVPDQVYFTTVYPGFTETPMTAKSQTAVGLGKKTYLKANYVAEKIVEGIRQNRQGVVIPRSAEVAIFMKGLMPEKLFWEIRRYLVSNQRKAQ
ncbi:estradiol 17-beta-dehydrogenase 11 [Folsomia candida]|uniref:estradiol 17-beta-dehydrogenase 11 n=1 Tax=Folsomia candida TaxID=158441 RepID=UPI000B905C68|nr:estradiol 17-beta-dehydrogenase 11 [Folsomia candida]